jgi:hypothetical protein
MAVIGIILQLGVIVFAEFGVFLGNWNDRFKANGGGMVPYAFPMVAGGTITLALGMFLYAYIIDRNTVEEKWVTPAPEDGYLKFAWLQKGKAHYGHRCHSVNSISNWK